MISSPSLKTLMMLHVLLSHPNRPEVESNQFWVLQHIQEISINQRKSL